MNRPRRAAATTVALAIALAAAPCAVPAQAASCLPGRRSGSIAFVRTSPGHQGIWTVRSDGRALRRVTADAGDVGPTWSPDGTHIAFTRLQPGADFDLFVIDADGTGLRNVTGSPETDEVAAAWSPDGKWIAYHAAPTSVRTGNSGLTGDDFEILATRPDGTGTRNISQRPPAPGEVGYRAAADVKPSWSPDGAWITFESYRGVVDSASYNPEIWAMPSGGDADAAVQLTHTPASSEWYPSWSPDGRRIAFMRQPHGGSFDIWVLTLATDRSVVAETRLTSNTKHDRNPSWSPDGRRIVFSSNRADGGIDVAVTGTGWNTHEAGSDQLAQDTWDLYAMSADDGTCVTRLTTLGDAVDPKYSPAPPTRRGRAR